MLIASYIEESAQVIDTSISVVPQVGFVEGRVEVDLSPTVCIFVGMPCQHTIPRSDMDDLLDHVMQ